MGYALAVIEGGPWPRRLALGPLPRDDRDIADIAAWGATLVLSLVQEQEAARAGTPELSAWVERAGIDCIRAPIVDYGVPDAAFERAWPTQRQRAIDILAAGGKVLAHCHGGRGRSGTIAAALLIAGGLSPIDAIALVRSARPGAIETPGQEAWLRGQS